MSNETAGDTTAPPAKQTHPIVQTIDSDLPTDQQAGRQRRYPQPDDGRDPKVVDLEDLIALNSDRSTADQPSPAERLRADLKVKMATAPKGTQKALARLVGVSPSHLSNFLGNRFSLNHGALAQLQEWIDGKLVIAPIGDAA